MIFNRERNASSSQWLHAPCTKILQLETDKYLELSLASVSIAQSGERAPSVCSSCWVAGRWFDFSSRCFSVS